VPEQHNEHNKDDDYARFLRLFAQHEGALRAFLRAMLTSREETAEAFQETSIILWEKFGEFDPSRDFKPWAFGIAKYKALARMRDRQRERIVFSDELVAQFADQSIASESRFLTQQEALDGCLRKLSAPLREIVLKAYAQGTRIDHLAESLGQTPMALYKKLHRIRRTLLECVNQSLTQEEGI